MGTEGSLEVSPGLRDGPGRPRGGPRPGQAERRSCAESTDDVGYRFHFCDSIVSDSHLQMTLLCREDLTWTQW